MLLDKRHTYKPFKYPFCYEAWEQHERMHWMGSEVPMADDVHDWKNKITTQQKEFLTQLFRFFTTADVCVGSAYNTKFLPLFAGNPEVAMMMSSISARENIHIQAYALLIDTVGMPESEYSTFLEYKAMKDKYDYLENVDTSTQFNIAKALAIYPGFTEGVQLFATFAMLIHFERMGLMKGMANIVRWSLRDEDCFTGDTEILTPKGWTRFDALTKEEKVAQYNAESGEVSFVLPLNYIEKDYSGKLVSFKSEKGGVDLTATENHDLLFFNQTQKGLVPSKVKFNEFEPHYRRKIPVAGEKLSGRDILTARERFLIALQADGSLDYRIENYGARTGTKVVHFSLTKQRKIDRLTKIVEELGWRYNIKPLGETGKVEFNVWGDVEIYKYFKEWVTLEDKSASWGREFAKELMYWDGHDVHGDQSVVYYSSVVSDNVDVVQSICAISGLKTSRSVQVDDRKESYSDVHRLWIYEEDMRPTGAVDKTFYDYSGKVYCVTVETGNIIVRQNNKVAITGNCHANNMLKVYNTFKAEYIDPVEVPLLESQILSAAETMVDLEDKFIDLSFGVLSEDDLNKFLPEGEDRLTKDSLKQYIRHMTDYRLKQMGIKPMYGIDKTPLVWLDRLLLAPEHTNFFEARPTEYSKGGLIGAISY